MPPERFEKPASFIKERKAAKAPEESVFKPGREPRDLKKFDRVNIPKEQRLPKEQRIREDRSRGGRGPATEIQTGGPENEKTRGNEKRIERGRVIAPETGNADAGDAPVRFHDAGADAVDALVHVPDKEVDAD